MQPTHRALDDAKATVDVLHGLIERLGSFRVHTLGEAVEFAKAVTPTQRRKRHLAEGLPHVPGVYVFRAADERALYVGTSKDIGTRVRTYFTASEKRARISEMLAAATRVEAVECAHSLEAEVRELRLIAAHSPPYNRRSKYPERVVWLKLTAEAYPRLSVVRALADDDAAYLGPFSSRRTAELAAAGVYDAVPLRQCTHKLSTRVKTPACALAELGRCPAPCEHEITPEEYAARAALPFRTATYGDPRPIVDALMARIDVLSTRQRYEEAAVVRSRLIALLRATVRMQRLDALTRLPSSSPPAATRSAAGRSWWCATAGSPPRPPRRRASTLAPPWTWPARRPRRFGPDRDPFRPPLPRRPSASSPGWNDPTLVWWRLPATGCHRPVAPRASLACSAGRKRPLRQETRPFTHL